MPQPRGGPGGVRRGWVASFDFERGLGVVVDERRRELRFHCTAIADGSRSIHPGTTVVFAVRPGHLGRMEAWDVTPVEPGRST